jgi:hypothetical protein
MTSTKANPAENGGALKNKVLGGTASALPRTNKQIQALDVETLDGGVS